MSIINNSLLHLYLKKLKWFEENLQRKNEKEGFQ